MFPLLRSITLGRVSGPNVPKCSSTLLRPMRPLHLNRPPPSLYHTTRHVTPSQSLRFSLRAFQRPCLAGSDHRLNLICDRAEIWSHITRFSHSSTRRLRKIYFPNSPPSGKNPKGGGPFSRLTAAINALPSGIILWTILGLNGSLYLLWNVGLDRAQNHQDMAILTSLFENFTLSWQNWTEGRFWTVLTSCFSNQATSHILLNAITFYFMAPPVLQILGNTSFLALYLGGGIASSLITLYYNQHFLKQRRVVHGASGAIYAVISFMASTAPKATFLIFGVVPVPAWGCVAGLFTWDLFSAIAERQTGVSEISHLSGIMFGIFYFLHKTARLPRFF